jgi:transcriptional regulator with XRE-family HTH domain
MTKKKQLTDVEVLEKSTDTRRLLRKEQLILDVTTTFYEQMEAQRITKADLARRLGKSAGFVTQLLAGDRNLTLGTIADLADALNGRLKVRFARSKKAVMWGGIETVVWNSPSEWPHATVFSANSSDLYTSDVPVMANSSDLDVAA